MEHHPAHIISSDALPCSETAESSEAVESSSSSNLRNTAIEAKLISEIDRLNKYYDDSLQQISCHTEALCTQIAAFVDSCKAGLAGQVKSASQDLEGALTVLLSSSPTNNKLLEQLQKLTSTHEIVNCELLQLTSSLTPCNITQVLSASATFCVSFAEVSQAAPQPIVKTADKQRIRAEPQAESLFEGSDEEFDVKLIKLEVSKIERPKSSKIGTPTASARLPQERPGNPPNKTPSGTKPVNKAYPKQLSLGDVKSVKPDRTRINTPVEPVQKTGTSKISNPALARRNSTDLDSSTVNTSSYSIKGEANPPKGSRIRAVPDIKLDSARSLATPTKTGLTSARHENPFSGEAMTERSSKSRLGQLTPRSTGKEEFKTTKPKPGHRGSLQVKPTDSSFRTSTGLRSPCKDLKGSFHSRTPGTPSDGQALTYFKSLTNKIISLNVETETVVTTEADFPDNFYEGAAWCETPTQELLYTGGFADEPLSRAWLISPSKRSFMEVAPMLTARHCHQLCAVNDMIFALGGAGPEPLEDCEYFSLRTCAWKKAGSLNFPRVKPAACVHNGRIYVAGGLDQDSIEVYDVVEETFTLLFVLLPSTGMAAMTTSKDSLIIVQGSTVSELGLSTLSVKELCSWKLAPYWSPMRIQYQDGLVYMSLDDEFIRFNIRTQTIEQL
jgi:hypothetical protein